MTEILDIILAIWDWRSTAFYSILPPYCFKLNYIQMQLMFYLPSRLNVRVHAAMETRASH